MGPRISIFILWLAFADGCSTQSAGGAYSEMTDDERAKQALDEGRFDDAIDIYTPLVEAEPENYSRHPLLAAALAARAGIDLVGSMAGGTGESGGGSAFDTLGQFVPTSPTDEQMTDLDRAIATLEAMPESHRNGDGTYDYSAGAALQLTLYQTMRSIMLVNRFAVRTDTGSIDPTSLQSMSDEEVAAVLDGLAAAAASSPDSVQGQAISTVLSQTLAGVDEQEGETRKDKLIAYMSRTS